MSGVVEADVEDEDWWRHNRETPLQPLGSCTAPYWAQWGRDYVRDQFLASTKTNLKMDEKNGAANTPVKKSSNQDQSGERVGQVYFSNVNTVDKDCTNNKVLFYEECLDCLQKKIQVWLFSFHSNCLNFIHCKCMSNAQDVPNSNNGVHSLPLMFPSSFLHESNYAWITILHHRDHVTSQKLQTLPKAVARKYFLHKLWNGLHFQFPLIKKNENGSRVIALRSETTFTCFTKFLLMSVYYCSSWTSNPFKTFSLWLRGRPWSLCQLLNTRISPSSRSSSSIVTLFCRQSCSGKTQVSTWQPQWQLLSTRSMRDQLSFDWGDFFPVEQEDQGFSSSYLV